jgi:hypothetical protein
MLRRAGQRFAIAAFAGLAFVAIGCSSGHDGTVARTASPEGAASATAVIGTAEPLPPSLEKVLQEVAALRHLPPPPNLKAGLVSRSQLPALLNRELTADDRASFEQTTTLYRLLGHLRKDQDYQSVYDQFTSGAVVGFYSPLDKELWVVHPDGQATDFDHLSDAEESTLAHELTHAVQDYSFNLSAVFAATKENRDRSLVSTCVIEGDAVTTESAFDAKYTDVPIAPSSGTPGAMLVVDRTALGDVPASIQRELLLPYTAGRDWVAQVRQERGDTAIDLMLKDPPDGTAYMLHPELLTSGFTPANVTLPDLATVLGHGWTRQSGGQFGEFELQNYLQLRIPGLDAINAADGWVGDHYDVYAEGQQSVAVFRVAFDSAAHAQRFEAAQVKFLKAAGGKDSSQDGLALTATNDGNTTARAAVRGSEVLFAIGSSKDIAAKALQAIANG